MRLSFSLASEEEIDRGMARLGALIAEAASTAST
jgi:DNA-binding transcriptional MocR family regulator